jgi:hypothetical protein
MPWAKRFLVARETIRTHPVIVATTAATGGVLLGGFVAFQLLAMPKLPIDGASDAHAAIETKAVTKPSTEAKAAPKPAPETTGSAPARESVASADCDQQTWPHLSRDCLDEFRAKNRAPRVVSTDKLDKLDKPTVAAIEAQAPAADTEAKLAAPAPWAPAVASPAPLAITPSPMRAASAAVPAAAPPPVVVAVATPEPVAAPAPTVAITDAANAQPPAQSTLKVDQKQRAERAAKKEREKYERALRKENDRIARQAKRQPRPQDLDNDDTTVATNDFGERAFDDRAERRASDDRATRRNSDGRADRRVDRSRIVERWTERDYDVPNSRGDGQRRVTVIRRDGSGGASFSSASRGGGLFESFFGMGGGRDD